MSLSKDEEALYDRQIRLWGFAAQKRLLSSHVLIIGASAINVEVIKNLLLAGIRISLADARKVEPADLGYNYFLREKDIGREVADACCPRIQDMNQHVQVQQSSMISVDGHNEAELSDMLANYTAILVACEVTPVHQQIKLNELCRLRGTAYFCSWCFGKYACCFADMVQRPKLLKGETSRGERQLSGAWDVDALEGCPSLRKTLEYPSGLYAKKTDASFYAFLALFNAHLAEEGSRLSATLEDKRSCSAKFLDEVDPIVRDQALALVEKITMFYDCSLAATAAVIGGVIAQEIRKLCTKSDMPLGNWIILNCDKSEVIQTTIP